MFQCIVSTKHIRKLKASKNSIDRSKVILSHKTQTPLTANNHNNMTTVMATNIHIIIIIIIIIWLYSPIQALASPFGFRNSNLLYRAGLLVQLPTPNLEDQVSVFMTPGDRVAQLYPQALGTHFSRLLRHAWVTVGLFFNPGHHTG
jgi:hypothetical protein